MKMRGNISTSPTMWRTASGWRPRGHRAAARNRSRDGDEGAVSAGRGSPTRGVEIRARLGPASGDPSTAESMADLSGNQGVLGCDRNR